MDPLEHTRSGGFVWNHRSRLPQRFGARCRILAEYTRNPVSVIVEFDDGARVHTTRSALRIEAPDPDNHSNQGAGQAGFDCMEQPLYVRALTARERRAVEAGLRSSDIGTARRSQILLASASGKRVSEIGRDLHIENDTALNVIAAFNERGLASLARRSPRSRRPRYALPPEHSEALKAILRKSPNDLGKDASCWTLDLLAEVAAEQGLATHKLTPEGIRRVLLRAGVRWRRAKRWVESPDPAHAEISRSDERG